MAYWGDGRGNILGLGTARSVGTDGTTAFGQGFAAAPMTCAGAGPLQLLIASILVGSYLTKVS